MFYDELRKKRLERNEKLFYTLNDENLDRLFCINDELTLTPNPYHIVNFATINYLYGLFDVTIDSFTAVPSGFMASYVLNSINDTKSETDNFYGTFWLSDTSYILNDLVKLCADRINLGENKEIYVYIMEVLKDENTSLLEKGLFISSYIKENGIRIFDSNIDLVDRKYQEINNKNCDDNHKILEKIVFKNRDKYDELMHTYILPGYLQYRGYDRENNPIDQNGQILNEVERICLLKKMLEYDKLPYYEQKDKLPNIVSVLNICSTDYSADIVYNVFKEIIDCKQYIDLNNVEYIARNIVESIVPKALKNEEDKQETRNSFKR